MNFRLDINGFSYANLPIMQLCTGSDVGFHMFSVGAGVDLHSLSFHGESLLDWHSHKSFINLPVGAARTAIMTPLNTGWTIGKLTLMLLVANLFNTN